MSEVERRWGEFTRLNNDRYMHECGASVVRSGKLWLSTTTDGLMTLKHRTLREATAHLYSNDPSCWAHAPGFGGFQPAGRRLIPSGGLMVEVGELERGLALTARTCERFPVARFAIRHFERYAFGAAACVRCGSPMTGFRLHKMPYTVDRVSDYPVDPPRDFRAIWRAPSHEDEAAGDMTLAWAFLVCNCGYPVWYHSDARSLSYELDRRQIKATRNERIRDAEGYYTDEDIEAISRRQDGRCLYCSNQFSEVLPPTVDHIVPLAAGGSHWPSNLCLACGPCNSKKGAMSQAEFIQRLEVAR